jgi:hypothetical protein
MHDPIDPDWHLGFRAGLAGNCDPLPPADVNATMYRIGLCEGLVVREIAQSSTKPQKPVLNRLEWINSVLMEQMERQRRQQTETDETTRQISQSPAKAKPSES